MTDLMSGHGDQVEPTGRDGERDVPELRLVEVQVASQIAPVRWWKERVRQDLARTVERGAVAVVAGDEADLQVGGRLAGLREGQWNDAGPQAERSLDRRF